MRLSNSFLELDVYPQHGFVITSISRAGKGRNILWNPPILDTSPLPIADLGPSGDESIETFDNEILAGGWFVMFPVSGLPGTNQNLWMHGEAARLSWEVVSQSRSELVCRLLTPASNFELFRKVTLNDRAVEVSMSATNLTGVTHEISIGEHPCFSRKRFSGSNLIAEPTRSQVTSHADSASATLTENLEFDWPEAQKITGDSQDLSQVPLIADGRHDHINLIGVSEVKLAGGADDVTLSWSSKEMPNVLLWQHFLPESSPWPGDVFAIEPTSAPGRTFTEAKASESLIKVGPGETISTWAHLRFSDI